MAKTLVKSFSRIKSSFLQTRPTKPILSALIKIINDKVIDIIKTTNQDVLVHKFALELFMVWILIPLSTSESPR